MTRKDILKTFPNATEEQITEILNSYNQDVEKEKEKSKELKDAAEELKKAQDEIKSLEEKINGKENVPEDWQEQINKLNEAYESAQKTIKNMELKNNLIEKGFGSDDADKFIKTMNEGGDIATVLGEMKTNVISAYDKDRMKNTPEASGSSNNNDGNNKTTAEKLAEGIVSASNEANNDVLANYK